MKYITIFITAIISLNCFGDNNCSMLNKDITLHFYIQGSESDPNNFDPNDFRIVDTYHTDIEVSFTNSGWDPHISFDSPGSGQEGERIEFENGLLFGNANTYYSSIPGGFEFTGAGSGDELWILPQIANNGELPLGFATQNSDSYSLCSWDPNDTDKGADSSAKWYKITLKDVRGPDNGQFSLWQTGPTTMFMSTYNNGITADDTYYMSSNGHRHLNWGFSKPGYYQIDFEIATVYNCREELAADIWPIGNGAFNGDCKIDMADLALLAQHWLENNCTFYTDCYKAEIYIEEEPEERIIDIHDLQILAEEWLICGYPGCE